MGILAGDIGGTHTRIALFEKGKLCAERKYKSREYKRLEEIVHDYLEHEKCTVAAASFGIAGAVRGGVCKATNLPWSVDTVTLSHSLGIESVYLINDLEANAYGVLALKEEQLFLLQRGDPSMKGNRALIAAGTGLGEAGLFWDGKVYHPFACEGGHADFAARDEIEMELLFYLKKRFGHVSYERVVSGPGLYALYQFLTENGHEVASPEVEEEMRTSDPPRVISAWRRKDPACARSLEWFLSLYGAEAGNLALKMLPFGGLFIGGGIAPHLIEMFQRGEFISSFCNKGRFDGLLESIPIWIVKDDQAALLGAAVYAERGR